MSGLSIKSLVRSGSAALGVDARQLEQALERSAHAAGFLGQSSGVAVLLVFLHEGELTTSGGGDCAFPAGADVEDRSSRADDERESRRCLWLGSNALDFLCDAPLPPSCVIPCALGLGFVALGARLPTPSLVLCKSKSDQSPREDMAGYSFELS